MCRGERDLGRTVGVSISKVYANSGVETDTLGVCKHLVGGENNSLS